MIETDDLTKTYHMGEVQVHALRGVSTGIEKGEFVGIMGPSGSGKSTFLHLAGLLDNPTSGAIRIGGKEVSVMPREEKARFRLEKMGYVFQDYAIIEDLTVLENVAVPGLGLGLDYHEVMEIASGLVDDVGLGGRAHHLRRELSGGQQQRVAIARALMNSPAIVFADEPCANLDTESSRMILDLFKRLNTEWGQTMVMVSHEPWHEQFFDRVIRFRDGRVDP
ncbi:MAG: ABC transporter ATP-binding protein [Methanospirillum sp.]|nr:ABC transporter ATP-binding protein [Methanospirillum sp.]MDD1728136.1 ABC transporter ATP-binding protein [Methanospirillum sp.]